MIVINDDLIKKINYYANKKKKQGLTSKEQEEQNKLRKVYLKQFKERFKKQLDDIEIVD